MQVDAFRSFLWIEVKPTSLHTAEHLPAHATSSSSKASIAAQQQNMALPTSAYKDREFLAVIGDEVRLAYTYVPQNSS